MTRKSERELERLLEGLEGLDAPDDDRRDRSDHALGVTADFVTYDPDATTESATFHVVEPDNSGGDSR